ncbi:MAG: DUF2066 domain-containing protein [Steroidobacteraceae bacterium]
MTTSMLDRRSWRCVLAWVSLLASSALVAATRTVDLGTVQVQASEPAEAYGEAMQWVLVRLTGRRAALSDPALQSLVQQSERYVQIFQPAGDQRPAQVTLDDLAIERVLDELGEPVWPRERPVVLGVILSAPLGADPQRVREALTRAAAERGLPIELSSASAAGLTAGRATSAGEALAAARRLGASAALVAESAGSQWRWTFYQATTGVSPLRFEGDVTAGIEGAADAFALGSQALSVQPVSEVELIVSGVSDLAAHGAVRRALTDRVAIKNIDLLEIAASQVRFRLQVSGGQRGLVSALDGDSNWQRDKVDGPLRYRFKTNGSGP